MPRLRFDELDGLTAADVVHVDSGPLPVATTVADARAWFAGSPRRNVAVLIDGDRYVGTLTADDLAGDETAGDRPAALFARTEPVIGAAMSALEAKAIAVAEPSRRVPVVAADGRYVGLAAVTADLQGFCGVAGPGGC